MAKFKDFFADTFPFWAMGFGLLMFFGFLFWIKVTVTDPDSKHRALCTETCRPYIGNVIDKKCCCAKEDGWRAEPRGDPP